MCIKHLKRVIDLVGLSATEKLVLLLLANLADKNGECFPGYSYLAIRTGKCTKTIKRTIERLVVMGHLIKIGRKKGSQTLSNLYRMVIPEVNNSEPEIQKVDSLEMEREITLPRDIRCPQVGTLDVPLTITNQSLNTSNSR